MPSYVLVPLPNSSNKTRLLSVILLRIFAASFISTINVDSPSDILSEAPTRVNILSTNPIVADSAGTKEPICASKTIRAVCRSSADLPAIFGPVIISICCSSLSKYTSFAIYGTSSGSCLSITGWRPFFISITSVSSIFGRIYLNSCATLVKDKRQSALAIILALFWITGIYSIKPNTSSLYILFSSAVIFSSAPNIFSS